MDIFYHSGLSVARKFITIIIITIIIAAIVVIIIIWCVCEYL